MALVNGHLCCCISPSTAGQLPQPPASGHLPLPCAPAAPACRLCYLFCRCTRSISVVPPAQYAHLAAFRGRVLCRGGASTEHRGRGPLPMAPLLTLQGAAATALYGGSCLHSALHLAGGCPSMPACLPARLPACPPACLPLASLLAGESETGSVSSGGTGGVEFLPVNSQLNKACAAAGRLLAGLQATTLLAVAACLHSREASCGCT